MEFEERDFTRASLDQAVALSNGLSNLESLFDEGTYSGPEVDKTLVVMLVVSRRLLDHVSPLDFTAGLGGHPAPMIYRNGDPSVDFAPWWLEKSSRLHDCIFKIAIAASMPDDAISQKMIDLCLEEGQHILGSMVDLLNSGGLIIRTLLADDGD